MINKWLRSSIAPVVLFALAAALIGFGGINAVLAAPRIQSGWYGGEAQLNDIDVMLTENGKQVHLIEGDGKTEIPLLQNLLKDEEGNPLKDADGEELKFQIGATYPEALGVTNTRNALNPGFDGERIIDEYVRVTVYQYWTRKNDEGKDVKAVDLNPAYIELNFVEGDNWTIAEKASENSERTVLYYKPVVPIDGETDTFTDTLRINPAVLTEAGYKDATFHIEAVVDAVQTHSGEQAMRSAWGRTNQG